MSFDEDSPIGRFFKVNFLAPLAFLHVLANGVLGDAVKLGAFLDADKRSGVHHSDSLTNSATRRSTASGDSIMPLSVTLRLPMMTAQKLPMASVMA